jgi:hypothetical protein
MGDWRQTPHGEYVCDGLGLVASAEQRVWWAYPFRYKGRLGPFPTPHEAQLALEEMRALPQVRDAADG